MRHSKRTQWEGGCLQTRKRALNRDQISLQNVRNRFLLFKPPILRYFVMVAQADWGNTQYQVGLSTWMFILSSETMGFLIKNSGSELKAKAWNQMIFLSHPLGCSVLTSVKWEGQLLPCLPHIIAVNIKCLRTHSANLEVPGKASATGPGPPYLFSPEGSHALWILALGFLFLSRTNAYYNS